MSSNLLRGRVFFFCNFSTFNFQTVLVTLGFLFQPCVVAVSLPPNRNADLP